MDPSVCLVCLALTEIERGALNYECSLRVWFVSD